MLQDQINRFRLVPRQAQRIEHCHAVGRCRAARFHFCAQRVSAFTKTGEVERSMGISMRDPGFRSWCRFRYVLQ